MHALSGIRTRNPSNQALKYSCWLRLIKCVGEVTLYLYKFETGFMTALSKYTLTDIPTNQI